MHSHHGLTKGAATLGFGLVGLAATSGTKTKVKSEKANLKLVVKKEITNIKYKKFSYTQMNIFKVEKIKNKINKNNFEIQLMKKSKNGKVIEESFNKKYKEESKNNNYNISNEKSEINYDNYSNENLINHNNMEFNENSNIMEMEMDKNEDLFKQENADLIKIKNIIAMLLKKFLLITKIVLLFFLLDIPSINKTIYKIVHLSNLITI